MIYYVSNSIGNNDYDGSSEDKPFKTLSKITNITFSGGDIVLLKCNDIWQETLTINTDDTGEVLISNYGNGEKPIISSAKICNSSELWELYTDGVYKINLNDSRLIGFYSDTNNVGFILDKDNNTIFYNRVQNISNLNNEMDFCEENGYLYLKCSSNPNIKFNELWFIVNTYNLVRMANNVHLNGLKIQNTGGHGIAWCGDNCIIENCEISNCGGSILFEDSFTRYGNGIELSPSNNVTIKNNTISNCYDVGFTIQGIDIINNNTLVVNNKFLYNSQSLEIWTSGDDTQDTGIQNFIFKDNICINSGKGWGSEAREVKQVNCEILFNILQLKYLDINLENNIYINPELLYCIQNGITPNKFFNIKSDNNKIYMGKDNLLINYNNFVPKDHKDFSNAYKIEEKSNFCILNSPNKILESFKLENINELSKNDIYKIINKNGGYISDMGSIRKITDKNGNTIYPITTDTAILSEDGISLNDKFQIKEDNSLVTNDKTIIGAINELSNYVEYSQYEWITQEINLVEGTGYDPSTGKPTTSLDNRTISFELNAVEGDKIKIGGFTFGEDIYKVMFIDKNDNLIGSAKTDVWGTPVEYEFICPSQTAKVRMNAWKNNAAKFVKKWAPLRKSRIDEILPPIPDFYVDYINEKIQTIKTLEDAYGCQGETIAFITDIHYPDNNMYSFPLLKKLIENTNISYVICGGDVIRDNVNLSIGKQNAYDFMKIVKKTIGDKFITIYGNHDNNSNQTNKMTKDEVYSIYFKHQENIVKPDVNKLNGLYWYLDNPIQKIRYIGLNTFEGTEEGVLSVAQMKWLCEEALNFPTNGWNVCFFSHRTTSGNRTGVLGEFRQIIRAIRYQSDYSATYTDYNQETYDINVNYAGKNHSVLFVAHGHDHYDYLNIDNDIAYFGSICDATYKDEDSVPTRTDINMQSFDIITINKKTNTINLTKIGAGSDRSFTFSNNG